ncbi:RAD55 family ATPase [Catenuloplanes atrovinosus]|uniref:non-specific serine/threonine protein kinase n=1 Tax=Catenuloplanes atrovinosus TaxID=137266 RepID=A0AAE3YRU1_9ACTN|nr:ATPase domain-containing protein [Catenuloplanes atrovinosus]MDR7276591.1 circadian clock protein KaiC [Catenuloplanes atrovinosus]
MKRLSTGASDLDLILGGGLEPGSVVVLSGPPGAGKTILAQQMCFAGAAEGRKAVYYTALSEPHSKLVEHLRGFSFFAPEHLGPSIRYVHLGDMLRDRSQGTFAALIDEVVRTAFEEEPSLVVIDSMKMVRDFVGEHDLRMSLYDLTSRVAHSGVVLLLLGEYTPEETQTGAEFAIADGIIQMSYEFTAPMDRRGLRVLKLRGTPHLAGTHTMHITSDGVRVHPRVESLKQGEVRLRGERVRTGIPGLDELTGGGIPRDDATLVLGPTGVGKTIGCLHFLAEGIGQGGRCLYITFQDTPEELIQTAATFGWDFEAARKDGTLIISHVPMGDLDLDALASVARHALADGTIIRIVIDGLSEMANAARQAQRFPAYLRSLLGVIRAGGASLWVTSETGAFGPIEEPLAGLMFLFHNVIQLRYIEHCAEIGRAVNILKMRNSPHDSGLHTCHVTGAGLTIGERLRNASGMLAWTVLRDCPPPGER